jgi:hypothetical protein
VFVNPSAQGSTFSGAEFFLTQQVLPVQMMWPATLSIAAVSFLAICALALVLMPRVVSNPSSSPDLAVEQR